MNAKKTELNEMLTEMLTCIPHFDYHHALSYRNKINKFSQNETLLENAIQIIDADKRSKQPRSDYRELLLDLFRIKLNQLSTKDDIKEACQTSSTIPLDILIDLQQEQLFFKSPHHIANNGDANEPWYEQATFKKSKIDPEIFKYLLCLNPNPLKIRYFRSFGVTSENILPLLTPLLTKETKEHSTPSEKSIPRKESAAKDTNPAEYNPALENLFSIIEKILQEKKAKAVFKDALMDQIQHLDLSEQTKFRHSMKEIFDTLKNKQQIQLEKLSVALLMLFWDRNCFKKIFRKKRKSPPLTSTRTAREAYGFLSKKSEDSHSDSTARGNTKKNQALSNKHSM